MTKIMHITQSAGGVKRYIDMFIKNIDKNKYQNILVHTREYSVDNSIDLKSEYVDMCREINFINDLKAVLTVRKLVKKYKPDIVYLHSSKAGVIGRLATIGIKNTVIYNAHGWSFNMQCSNKKRLLYSFIERLFAPFTDKIVAISDFEKNSAVKNHICSSDKIQVIYNGIDIDEQKSKISSLELCKKSNYGIPDDAYVVGMVGRISKQKAPDTFIKMAYEIKKSINEAFFVIVGDGEDRKECEVLIKKLHLEDSFLITGWNDNPMEYVNLFDQAVLLSRWEGFGLVLAEYMIAKKPIVATNVDAIPNLIQNGENGVLVEKDDYIAAAKEVVGLYRDEEHRKLLCKKGYDVVCVKFDIKRVISEHEKLFRELL